MYICDRKTHSLITPPYHLTNLVNNEEVELKFTAPGKPGHYNFTVCVRSDSYLGTVTTFLSLVLLDKLAGVDLMDDIRLDVQEAREAPTAHPQWEFEVILFVIFHQSFVHFDQSAHTPSKRHLTALTPKTLII